MLARIAGSLLIVVIGALPAWSQPLQGGIKGGAAFTSLSNVFTLTQGDEDDSDIYAGPMVGGFLSIDLREFITLQPEFFYVAKGASLPDEGSGTGSLVVRYVEIPLMVRFSSPPARGKSLYVLGGPTLGFKLDATMRHEDDDEEEDVSDRVSSTEFGVAVGLGLQGSFWLIEGRFSQGLKNIAIEDDDHPVKTRAVVVMLGFRF